MTTIRIFISSPGDVAEEREKAREVIAQLQRRYGSSVLLQPVLWEDLPLKSDASFQEGIDLILSKNQGIDIAVFMLWSRLGSPLGAMISKPDGSPYLSGTEREWDLMLQARAASGGQRPEHPYLREERSGRIHSGATWPAHRKACRNGASARSRRAIRHRTVSRPRNEYEHPRLSHLQRADHVLAPIADTPARAAGRAGGG